MVHRIVKPLKKHSFFLFGARGTGKTYFLDRYLDKKTTLKIDLLDPEEERILALDPNELKQRIFALDHITHVYIDEVQKLPKLLDLVHQLIESTDLKFVLSGSSARKLKRGGANLLAGRAFVYNLFPLVQTEYEGSFSLSNVLEWGSLPKLLELNSKEEKELYLKTYVNTYVKEEILIEQVIRKLEPFRRFLEIAAQSSGKIINFSKIGRDVGVSTKTVQSYFQILEDTLIGRLIQPFNESVRKGMRSNPKFYFFDYGVKRALDRTLKVLLVKQTYAYGNAFEHFVINEINALQDYKGLDWELSYIKTHDDAEIDLVIDRPGEPRALIEITSTNSVNKEHIRNLISLGNDISNSKKYCISTDPNLKEVEGVLCLPYTKIVEILFKD